MNTRQGTDQLAPWTGLGVFALYVVAALALGLYVLRRRDA
jgi:ABC-type transport system involved in multi-copper enzyme maturation permease subunit